MNISSNLSLHPAFSKDICAEATDAQRKHFRYSVVSKICFVARLAFSAMAVAYLTGLYLSPIVFGASILSFIVASHFQEKTNQKVAYYTQLKDNRTGQAQKLVELHSKTEDEIAEILIEHANTIRPEFVRTSTQSPADFVKENLFTRNDLQLLTQKNPNAPLKALLPVLASYLYAQGKVQDTLERISPVIGNSNQPIEERTNSFSLIERQLIPTAAMSTFLFNLLLYPSSRLANFEAIGHFEPANAGTRLINHWAHVSTSCWISSDGNNRVAFQEAYDSSSLHTAQERLRAWLDLLTRGPLPVTG
ncbi:MAG TPA: hypothetical protein VJK48_00520 [Chlamydiales bacterium]|nr:hypothetical protein [Chlamydiales bacterium]